MTWPPCRLLKGNDVHIVQRMVNVLELLGRDPEMNDDIRVAGGIPLLLSILQYVLVGVVNVLFLRASGCK